MQSSLSVMPVVTPPGRSTTGYPAGSRTIPPRSPTRRLFLYTDKIHSALATKLFEYALSGEAQPIISKAISSIFRSPTKASSAVVTGAT
jgi:hypothetical protein